MRKALRHRVAAYTEDGDIRAACEGPRDGLLNVIVLAQAHREWKESWVARTIVDFRTIGGSASGTLLHTKFLPIGEVCGARYNIILNR